MSSVPPVPASEQEVSISDALRLLTNPPALCPGCVAAAGQPWPEHTTSRYCPSCIARMRRIHQCRRWNANSEHQARAGRASFDAFSARWRAASGLAPLTVEAARRYIRPQHIRGPVGAILPHEVRGAIYIAWCSGNLRPVEAWLLDMPLAFGDEQPDILSLGR